MHIAKRAKKWSGLTGPAPSALLLYNAFEEEEEAGPSGLAFQEAVL